MWYDAVCSITPGGVVSPGGMSLFDFARLLITGKQVNPAYTEYLEYVKKNRDEDVLGFGEWVEKFKGGMMDKKWRRK